MSDPGFGGPSGPGGNPPGWYPDATTAGQNRWWDGQTWTEHVQPAAPAGGTPAVGFGDPGPPGATPAPWGDPGYVPPQKSARKKWWMIGGAVVAVLVVLGGIGAVLNQDKANNAEVGDCLKVNKFDAADADLRKVDCGERDAVFQVGQRLKGAGEGDCGDEDYVQYYEKGAGVDDFSLCLIYNVKTGECIFDSGEQLNRIDCNSGPAPNHIKIVDVISGVNDPARCPGDSAGPAYPSPLLTICGEPL